MLTLFAGRTGTPRPLTQYVVLGFFLFQFMTSSSATKLNLIKACKSILCFCNDDNGVIEPVREAPDPNTNLGGVYCLNPDAPKHRDEWGIWKLNSFPTVEQILEDILRCGIANHESNTGLFYSFGGSSDDAKEFKTKEASKGINLVMLTDIMPQHFITAAGKFGTLSSRGSPASVLWISRFSQAFAKAVHGDVYCFVSGKTEPINGIPVDPATIYTIPIVNQEFPWMGRHNVWYDYEFSTLQKNDQVRRIITVRDTTLEPVLTEEGTWIREPRQGVDANYHIDANTVTLERIQAKRDYFNNNLDGRQKAQMEAGQLCMPEHLQKRTGAPHSCPVATPVGSHKPSKTSASKPKKGHKSSKSGSKKPQKGHKTSKASSVEPKKAVKPGKSGKSGNRQKGVKGPRGAKGGKGNMD